MDTRHLDKSLTILQSNKDRWAMLSISEKICPLTLGQQPHPDPFYVLDLCCCNFDRNHTDYFCMGMNENF